MTERLTSSKDFVTWNLKIDRVSWRRWSLMAPSLTTRPWGLTWPRGRRGTEAAEVEAEGGEAEAAGAMMTGDMAAEDTMTGEEAEAGAMMTEEEAADITTTEVRGYGMWQQNEQFWCMSTVKFPSPFKICDELDRRWHKSFRGLQGWQEGRPRRWRLQRRQGRRGESRQLRDEERQTGQWPGARAWGQTSPGTGRGLQRGHSRWGDLVSVC